MCELAEDIGSGRRDEEKINPLRDGDVLDRAFDIRGRSIVRAEHFRDDFLAGESSKGERRDELTRGACHHDLDIQVFLLQATD